jgi:hypothetical protein
MRLLRIVAFSLSLFFTGSILANGQATVSRATVGDAWADNDLCDHRQTAQKPTHANCSGAVSDPNHHYSGVATSGSATSFGVLAIAGSAVTTSDDQGGTASIYASADANLTEAFSLGNFPDGSNFLIGAGLIISGSEALSTVQETAVLAGSNGSRSQCINNTFGQTSCIITVPVTQQSPYATAYIDLFGTAYSQCGPPTCAETIANFTAGYKGPGGGSVLIVKVVDSNGNPVKGATVTSASGHKYPTLFASTTTLTSSPNPSAQGDPVTFTATIASFGRPDTPTGTVTFKDSTTGKRLGNVTINAGVASLTTSSLASGTHTITASYGGDEWSAPSKSTVIQVVN